MIPLFAFLTSPWLYPALGLYVLLFMVVVIGIGIWHRRKRRERVPVEFKLLRGPGETLRRKIAEMDENLILIVLAGAFGPILATYPALWLLIRWQPDSPSQLNLGLGGVLLIFILSAILGGRWLWSKVVQRRNYLLGYLGERSVAEELIPLWREGYRIYHDLPAESGNRKFNLDHVVVGPSGVFAIETKTRRKGRARPGFKDHEVTFDGQKLIWPWGEDRHGLDQAESEARWLSELLHRKTGLELTAKPILALPGWYVKATARGAVNVVNAKNLPNAVKGRAQRVLTDEQIDLIARQLEDRCRDVED